MTVSGMHGVTASQRLDGMRVECTPVSQRHSVTMVRTAWALISSLIIRGLLAGGAAAGIVCVRRGSGSGSGSNQRCGSSGAHWTARSATSNLAMHTTKGTMASPSPTNRWGIPTKVDENSEARHRCCRRVERMKDEKQGERSVEYACLRRLPCTSSGHGVSSREQAQAKATGRLVRARVGS